MIYHEVTITFICPSLFIVCYSPTIVTIMNVLCSKINIYKYINQAFTRIMEKKEKLRVHIHYTIHYTISSLIKPS